MLSLYHTLTNTTLCHKQKSASRTILNSPQISVRIHLGGQGSLKDIKHTYGNNETRPYISVDLMF
jgi:hypothetical protein